MNNILEQLRSDMTDAGREAHERDEYVLDACLEVLDEFIAGQEVVEVDFDSADPYTTPVDDRIWYASLERQGGQPVRVVTIIVPRTEPPSLLAAAAADAVLAYAEATIEHAGTTNVSLEEVRRVRAALAAAIKRARDGDA